jgi:hypothetical protein
LKRELSLGRGEVFRARKFHKKCWPKFVDDVLFGMS